MYKVLLVDDEKWVTYGLQYLIVWENYGFHIIKTASDGVEAKELVAHLQPDLLISDIRMPELNGIELVEYINSAGVNTVVIFMSGYNDFTYAQKATRLGAFDYLLKPIDPDELVSALLRVKNHLDIQKDSSIWNGYFYLFDESSRLTIEDVLHYTNRKSEFIHCWFIIIKTNDMPMKENRLICPGHSTAEYDSILFRVGKERIGVMLFTVTQCINSIQRYSLSAAYLKPDTAAVIGISGRAEKQDLFYRLYLQAAISSANASFHQNILIPYVKIQSADASSYIKRLDKMNSDSSDAVYKSQIQELIRDAQDVQIDFAIEIYNRLIHSLHQRYADHARHLETWNIYEYLSSPVNIKEFFSPILEFLAGTTCSRRNISSIHAVLQYIEAHYMEDIHLKDLAKHFYLTENYLSTFIKKQTNQTFTDLLMNKRITLAQELLINTALSIQEITEQVGYTEYSHFCKVFKKRTGYTLTDYRRNKMKS